jgi:hypothetical protein
MNKFTYGNTPAAIYLAEYLTENGTSGEIRKVTRALTHFSRVINELERSNYAGTLSAHVIGGLAAGLREQALNTTVGGDSLVIDLVRNVMIGRLKDLTRRVQKVRIFEHQRATSYSAPTIALDQVFDDIDSETLIERSTARLKRLNKVNTLY